MVSDRVQKTPEGHVISDGTMAGRADNQRRSVDGVSVPSRRQILWHGTNEAATSQDGDFILDTLRHVKPVEIVMHQLREAAVELPGTSQNAGCHIYHTLQFVGDDRRSPGKNDITVIHT